MDTSLLSSRHSCCPSSSPRFAREKKRYPFSRDALETNLPGVVYHATCVLTEIEAYRPKRDCRPANSWITPHARRWITLKGASSYELSCTVRQPSGERAEARLLLSIHFQPSTVVSYRKKNRFRNFFLCFRISFSFAPIRTTVYGRISTSLMEMVKTVSFLELDKFSNDRKLKVTHSTKWNEHSRVCGW